ncbi:hypothetical protein JCM9279_000659 [Rhodotorula babjevae]
MPLPDHAAVLAKDPFTRRSLNLAQLLALFALAGAVALVVFLLTNLVVFPPRRTLTPTEVNTLLNRRENGGTGVFARKWRKRLLPARQFGDEHVLADAGIDAPSAAADAHKWHMRSSSPPPGLRSCLKGALAPAPPTSCTDEPTAPARPAKQVRIAEPSLAVELEALRERWASPDMQGEQGYGGIGGYRSTRDFVVARGKGAAAAAAPASKPASTAATASAAAEVLLPGKDIPATRADDDEAAFEVEEDDAEPLARRLQRHHPRLSAHAVRTSSSSPSPRGRLRRALSPASLHPSSSPSTARSSSPAFVVGHHSTAHKASPSKQRALSPNTAAPLSRAHSVSPGGVRAAPRWVRTKGGKLASPAPVRWAVRVEAGSGSGSEVDEVEEGEIELEDAASDLEDGEEACPSPPRGISTQLAGIAAVAAVAPPLPPSAALRLVSPSGPASPALSVLSGGESPQESPTPSPARLPALAVTPSSLPALPAQPLAPAPPPSASSTFQSTASSASSASTSSPSPSVGAERRLSLRVEQALRDKHGQRRPSRELELQVGAGAGRASALTA